MFKTFDRIVQQRNVGWQYARKSFSDKDSASISVWEWVVLHLAGARIPECS